jgi:hypothetical protein
VTGSDYPVLQDYEAYKEIFAYIDDQIPTPHSRFRGPG